MAPPLFLHGWLHHLLIAQHSVSNLNQCQCIFTIQYGTKTLLVVLSTDCSNWNENYKHINFPWIRQQLSMTVSTQFPPFSERIIYMGIHASRKGELCLAWGLHPAIDIYRLKFSLCYKASHLRIFEKRRRKANQHPGLPFGFHTFSM